MNTLLKKITLFAFSIMFAFGGTFAPLSVAFADAPAAPTPSAPADGSTVTNSTFTFDWDDATGGAAPYTYNWQASTSPDNTAGVLDSTIASHTGLSDSLVESPGTPDATYYWQVQAVDANNEVSSWSSIWSVTVDTAPVVIEPELNAENFNTVDGNYKGISVGFNAKDFGTVTAVTVDVTRADGSHVIKTGNSGVFDIISGATTAQQLTAPIVIEEGSFTEASDTTYWNPAPAVWNETTTPTSVKISITDENGTKEITNSTFSQGSPSWPTYESLLPAPSPTLDAFPSTNDQNRANGNPHVNLVSSNIGSVTLEFVNPKGQAVWFEKRIDNLPPSGTGMYGPCRVGIANPNGSGCDGRIYLAEDDISYPSKKVEAGATVSETFSPVTENISIRMTFGPERDWDFDWVSFDALSDDRPRTDIEVTGNTVTLENPTGWWFNRDTSTMSPFEFTNDQHSIGSGSLFVKPITNTLGTPGEKDKFIAELFEKTEISKLNSFSYDVMLAGGSADKINLSVYANIDNSDNYYDCRYDYIPSGVTTGSFATATIYATDTPVQVVKSSTGRQETCPATLAGMPSGSFARVFAINVGDTSASDTGLSAYLDKVVLDTDDEVTTYDFEKAFVDTTAPEIVPVLPTDSSTVGGIVEFIVKVTDTSGVQKVHMYVYDSTGAKIGPTHSMTQGDDDEWLFNLDMSAMTDGDYQISYRAVDNAGNAKYFNNRKDSYKVTLDNTLPDTTPPSITISAPTEGGQVLGVSTLNIKGTITDPNFKYYYCYLVTNQAITYNGNPYTPGQEVGVRDANCVTTWSSVETDGPIGSIDMTGLPNGSYTINVVAYDTEGNNNADLPVSVTFDYDTTSTSGSDTDNVPALDGNPLARSSSRRVASFGGSTSTGSTGGQVLGAESYNFTLLLKRGSRGTEVMELQKFLNAGGYNSGVEDGIFGPITEAAVKAFQRANGLVADGIVGPLTRAVLNA